MLHFPPIPFNTQARKLCRLQDLITTSIPALSLGARLLPAPQPYQARLSQRSACYQVCNQN